MTAPAIERPRPLEIQLYKIPDAMQALNLSRSVIYELMRAGRLRYVCEGRARRIPASAISEYVALLESEARCGR